MIFTDFNAAIKLTFLGLFTSVDQFIEDKDALQHKCNYFIPFSHVTYDHLRILNERDGWGGGGGGWDASKTVWLNMDKSAAPPCEALISLGF